MIISSRRKTHFICFISFLLINVSSRAVGRAFRRRRLISQTLAHSLSKPCGNCGAKCGFRENFSPRTSVLWCQITFNIYPIAIHSPAHLIQLSLTSLLDSQVAVSLRPLACWTARSNPAGGIDACLVNVVFCVDIDPCDGPIPRPEESYRVCVCVCVCVCVSSSVIKRKSKTRKKERNKKGKFICNFFYIYTVDLF